MNVLLFSSGTACDRTKAFRDKPTLISPYWTMCDCPRCHGVTALVLEKWEKEDGENNVFTVKARDIEEAVGEGRRLQTWVEEIRPPIRFPRRTPLSALQRRLGGGRSS